MAGSDRLSIRAYAQRRKERGLAGGTHHAVQKAIASGRIADAVDADGRIDPDAADALWEGNTRAAMSPDGNAGMNGSSAAREAAITYAIARAKLTAARAAQAQDDLAVSRGQLVPSADVLAMVTRPLEAVDQQLRTAPRRHARAWAARLNISQSEAMALIADLVEEIRTVLRTNDRTDAAGTPLPDDFPAQPQLGRAGLTTLEAVAVAELTDVAGIGPARAKAIRTRLRKLGVQTTA